MNIEQLDSETILQKVLTGERLFPEEAIHLCAEGDLISMGLVARSIAGKSNPDGRVGYTVSKSIRYSNVCQPRCPFCTGTVTADHPDAFTRTADEVAAEVAEAVAEGATEVILQGGHRIDLPWEYYPGLLRAIKGRCPQVRILAFSPTEIMVMNAAYQMTSALVLAELKAAGMGGLFAGGADGLNSRAPEYAALLRGPWSEWFDVVHRSAEAALPVTAPFVFGLGESARERVGHLMRVRAVQERTAAAGRPAFDRLAVFTLQVQPEHGEDAREQMLDPEGEAVPMEPAPISLAAVTGHEYLRMVALARILVPSIPHVQCSFLSQGAKVAQVALAGGADHMGGTHIEFVQAELAAGRVGAMTAAEMERLIRDAGRLAVEDSGL